jgi:hypothetical protein
MPTSYRARPTGTVGPDPAGTGVTAERPYPTADPVESAVRT